MDNIDNELSSEEIGIITSDFVKVSDQLKTTCNKIVEKKFSKYPIIIMSRNEVKLGTLLVDINEINDNKWKYFASYLEILQEKKIINDLKVFKESYKNSDEYCCLLTVLNNNSKIIFIPYPED